MSGSASGEFAEGGQEAGGGARIVEGIERDGGGKLRRLGTEANLENVLLPDGHQGVEFGRGILFPVGAGSEHDRARFVDIPFTVVALAGADGTAVSAPAMADNFEMESRRAAKIRFEGQRFFLFVDAAHEPLHGKSARAEAHHHMRVFEAAGCEMQAGMEAVAIEPFRFENASLTGACRLDPAQRFGSATAVVGGKQNVPCSQSHNCADNVDG